jgi:hypothetical protein
MSWTGRKRGNGERKLSGDLKRPRKPKPIPPQPHRKGYGSNPLAETQHGRYFLDGAINGPQHLAGSFYGRSRLRYRAAIGSPDSLRSRFEGRGEKATDDDPDGDIRCINEYLAARSILGRLTTDVEWVVIQNAMLADLTDYREGLDLLRRFYGV